MPDYMNFYVHALVNKNILFCGAYVKVQAHVIPFATIANKNVILRGTINYDEQACYGMPDITTCYTAGDESNMNITDSPKSDRSADNFVRLNSAWLGKFRLTSTYRYKFKL